MRFVNGVIGIKRKNADYNMKDITGQTFGYLTALGRSDEKCCHIYKWKFRCVCGKEVNIVKQSVLSGKTRSCGCKAAELGRRHITHGYNHTRLQRIYNNMKQRCYNSNRKDYYLYGGRGITVCDLWLTDSPSFFSWAENNGYNDDLQLDRIDNSLGYSPDNCRWVTPKEQASNRRMKRNWRFNGQRISIPQLCNENTMPPKVVNRRLNRGWSLEDALYKPLYTRVKKTKECGL